MATALRPSSRRIPAWRVGLLLAIGVPGMTGGAAACASSPRTHTVTIEGTSFTPAVLTIKAGETVVWINKDPFPHTATSAGAFDSGSIAAEKSWKFVAERKGTFDYICTLHPMMKARLTVE